VHRLQVARGAAPLTGNPAESSETGEARAGATSAEVHRSTRTPFLISALVIAADQLTKVWAAAALADGPILVVGELLQLRLTRNPGGAFGLFTGVTPFLAVLAALLAVFMVRTARRTDDRVTAYSLALVLGGAVGNLIDRLARDPGFLRGEVVDFIRLPHWPTFNLADSAITVGILIMLGWSWRAR